MASLTKVPSTSFRSDSRWNDIDFSRFDDADYEPERLSSLLLSAISNPIRRQWLGIDHDMQNYDPGLSREHAEQFAHELGNLLFIFHGIAERIRTRDVRNEHQTSTSLLFDTVQRAKTLADQFLRASPRQDHLLPAKDANELVTSIKQTLRALCSSHVELEVELSTLSCPVRIDPLHFDLVMVNLVVNANDALVSEPQGKVAVRINSREDIAEISVSDNGSGMKASTMEHMFDRFYTTKGTVGGTGIGLSTVQDIVRKAEGSIEVQSEPGVGTTFVISLPLSR